MNREEKKAKYEWNIFCEFLDRSKIHIDPNTVKKGDPIQREPDFLCSYDNGMRVGFELGRLIDPNLAKAINRWEPINGEYIRTSDPSRLIAKNKLRKKYLVAFPVELLLYKEYPIITPDNVLLPTIKPMCQIKHNYFRVWFMGNSVELLYERNYLSS
jgi:hypothetical protein